jgi:hypothetical protein
MDRIIKKFNNIVKDFNDKIISEDEYNEKTLEFNFNIDKLISFIFEVKKSFDNKNYSLYCKE